MIKPSSLGASCKASKHFCGDHHTQMQGGQHAIMCPAKLTSYEHSGDFESRLASWKEDLLTRELNKGYCNCSIGGNEVITKSRCGTARLSVA